MQALLQDWMLVLQQGLHELQMVTRDLHYVAAAAADAEGNAEACTHRKVGLLKCTIPHDAARHHFHLGCVFFKIAPSSASSKACTSSADFRLVSVLAPGRANVVMHPYRLIMTLCPKADAECCFHSFDGRRA